MNVKKWIPLIVFILALGFQGTEEAYGQETHQLTMATASVQGSYYPVGTAISRLMAEHDKTINISVQTTAGGVENARLIDGNQSDIAFFPSDTLVAATRGQDPFDEKIELRQVMSVMKTPIKFVAPKKTGIKSIQDLKGRRVAVNSRGSSIEQRGKNILIAAGITYDDIKPLYVGMEQMGDLFKNRQAEAGIMSGADPSPAVMDITTTQDVRIINIDSETIASIEKKFPSLFKTTIPGGTYENIKEDVTTVANTTIICANPNVPEDVIYRIVKTVFENIDNFKKAHGALANFDKELAVSKPIAPWHPGAVKYFEEAGLNYNKFEQ